MRTLIACVVFALVIPLASSCADQPLILFANHRDEPVNIHIDGDRVLILRPFTAEGLPYTVASWTWPRRIEAYDFSGRRLLALDAGAGDLANGHWRVDIR